MVAMPFNSSDGSNEPLTIGPVPFANWAKPVAPPLEYSRIQYARLGLVTVPVTFVTLVTLEPSVGEVMLTVGGAPVAGPRTTKAPPKDSCCAPLVTDKVRRPTEAFAAITICAVAKVSLVTATGPGAPAA